jgi:hypothetical protein
MSLRQRSSVTFEPPISFPREEFIAERFDYSAGEHVTFLAPTQSGKTTLGFELLEATANVEVPAIVLVQKPRDGVVSNWLNHLRDNKGWIKTQTWPPNPMRKRAPGYIVWPPHRHNPDTDNPRLRDILWTI